MFSARLERIVLFLMVLGVGAFLAIAVRQARIAAQKLTSQNNLRQIALSVQNYEGAFKSLPPGCDQQARNGWMSLILPFLESSDWYSHLDTDLSWEHPINQHQFTISIPTYCSPSTRFKFTTEGYAITCYHANPAIMYRGSETKFSDLSAGLSNIWLAGEIADNHSPFGYPFNWRQLKDPADSGSDNFGGWGNGAYFAMVDGDVRYFDKDIDASTLRALATALPLPEQSLYAPPSRTFTLGTPDPPAGEQVHQASKYDFTKMGPLVANVWLADDRFPEFIDFMQGHVQVQQLIQKHARATVLRIRHPQDRQELELISSLQDLKSLVLMEPYDFSNQSQPSTVQIDELIATCLRLPKLKQLKLRATDSQLIRLREALPNCEIISSSPAAPKYLPMEGT